MEISSRPCSSAERARARARGPCRPVVVDDLAQHAGRVEAGHAGQVDGGLGVAGPLEHAALAERSGKMWPGRARSPGRVAGSMSAWMVAARSTAEMPVRRAVAVVDGDGERGAHATRCCRVTISGRSSSSSRSPVIGTQMTPEVWCRKNAIFSGVADSAAMMRSPSFSRSSSSTTTTISPRPMAATASSIGANGISVSCSGRRPGRAGVPGEQALDVLGHDVDLEVDPVARALVARAW